MPGQFDLVREKRGKAEYQLKGSRGAGTTVTGKANAMGLADRLGRRAAAYGKNRSTSVKAEDDFLQGMEK